MTKTTARIVLPFLLLLVAAVLCTVPRGSEPAGAAPRDPVLAHTFSSAQQNSRSLAGLPLAQAAPSTAPRTGGQGFLAVFQEASPAPLDITVGSFTPVTLSMGDYNYGNIPAGTYPVTASSGSTVVATGTVSVANGQSVTALVYLAVGGATTITGFPDDRSPVPGGQSRIVFRNTANVGPVDVWLNGKKVYTDLPNDGTASFTTVVGAGPMLFEFPLTGHPENQYVAAVTGNLVAGDLLNVFVVGDPSAHPSTIGVLTNANPLSTGYRLYAADGGVFGFGSAAYFGSMGGRQLNKPIVGASPTSVGQGYWLVASDGGIFSFGDASFYGSTGGLTLNKPIVGMASTPDDGGYWLVASDGGIFAYGDAQFYGSMGAQPLDKPIVGIAVTPDGRGYWLVASDGGIFSFGDAAYFGSTGGTALDKPIVGMAATVDGRGYWLVASDGGIFSFGDAEFHGSMGGQPLNRPIVAAVTTPDSLGYWLVASDGGIFSFGDANFLGSTGDLRLNSPIVFGTTPGAPLPS